MFIVDDPDIPIAEVLPREYGVDDIPVIVQDKKIDDEGNSAPAPPLGGTGLLGDTLLVNGTHGPYLDVTTERVRLRLSPSPPGSTTSASRTTASSTSSPPTAACSRTLYARTGSCCPRPNVPRSS